MVSVPAMFKAVVLGLVTAIFTSYKEPLGASQWARRYSALLSESPLDDPAPLPLPPHPNSTGVYTPNNLLQKLTKLGEGEILLPEDVLADPTETFFYVSNSDGWIKKYFFASGDVHNWTYVGGRPLGLALDLAGDVLVCEPIQGLLLKINKETSAIETLTTEAEGVKLGLINGVIVASDGLIYFTDSTTKYNLTTLGYDLLEGRPHGRLLEYNPKTNSTTVLMKDLYFTNGITLSKSEEYLIYSETPMSRVSKYFLKGEKQGRIEIFIENLPGGPDNLHSNKARDRFYIALVGHRDALSDYVQKTPVLKHILASSTVLYNLYDPYMWIGKVLEVDEYGKALRLYEDTTGKAIAYTTVGVPIGGYLYVGGLRDNFVGRIKLES